MFGTETARLRDVLGSGEFHHVGSTAVPGLFAKPEIDILVVVASYDESVGSDQAMAALGYVRGRDMSEGHRFYRKDVAGIRTHKVHVCIVGHPQIDRMLRFRDLLRSDEALRQRYQELKLQLESENEGGIKEYLAKKAPFIDAVFALGPREPNDR